MIIIKFIILFIVYHIIVRKKLMITMKNFNIIKKGFLISLNWIISLTLFCCVQSESGLLTVVLLAYLISSSYLLRCKYISFYRFIIYLENLFKK